MAARKIDTLEKAKKVINKQAHELDRTKELLSAVMEEYEAVTGKPYKPKGGANV